MREAVDVHADHTGDEIRSHGHLHSGHESHHEKPMSPEEAVRSLLLLGQVALDAKDYESAAEAFGSILQIEPNEVALYNLASFRARGLGVKRNLVEAARLFHQAELLGNERAGILCRKCMFDYIRDGFEDEAPLNLYVAMTMFVTRVYPEAADKKGEVCNGLLAIAHTHLNREEYAEAAKVFRAAAECGDDGYAQYCLTELYRAGVLCTDE